MSDFNAQLMAEFRANGGKVGGMFDGSDVLILTSTGAKSGQPREQPLVYIKDGERFIIVASNGGSDAHPAWYYNLVANPDASIEVGTETISVDAESLEGDERERAFDAVVARYPGFADYKAGTSRVIPVFALTPEE